VHSSFPSRLGDQEQAQLTRASVYLHDHFAEALNLTDLARLAGFSKFHFHRLFKMQYGETPGDYVKRLRLEQTAYRLLAGDKPSITDLAYRFGFSSSQHLTGSFREHFGVPPGQVRDRFDWRDILLKKIQVMESSYGKKHCLPVNIDKGKSNIRFPKIMDRGPGCAECPELEVVDMPSYGVGYIRLQAMANSEPVARAMQTIIQWSLEKRLFMLGGGQLMIAAEIVPDAEGRHTFDVCITFPEELAIHANEEIKVRNLPGGLYGVYHGKFRNMEEFAATRASLIRDWWISSYFPRDQRPRYIIFYNPPSPDPASTWLADICFPITTLQK